MVKDLRPAVYPPFARWYRFRWVLLLVGGDVVCIEFLLGHLATCTPVGRANRFSDETPMHHWSIVFVLLFTQFATVRTDAARFDVIVYGGTSAGVTAAVQAKRMGHSVVIVCPDIHLGGLTSGGLGFTDTGNKAVIGGLSREFYHRIWKYYQTDRAWPWQSRSKYGNKGKGLRQSMANNGPWDL